MWDENSFFKTHFDSLSEWKFIMQLAERAAKLTIDTSIVNSGLQR